jgi:glycyl-tRNA synthetase (class II)
LPKQKKQEDIDRLERIIMDSENYNSDQIDAVIKELAIKDPDTGNDLSNATPFNLMFTN